MKRKTIKKDILETKPPTERMVERVKKNDPGGQSKKSMERITFYLPIALIERLRNASYWINNKTLSDIALNAFEKEIILLEKKNGGAFEQREQDLKRGRKPAK